MSPDYDSDSHNVQLPVDTWLLNTLKNYQFCMLRYSSTKTK
jgi:hypothetical protein